MKKLSFPNFIVLVTLIVVFVIGIYLWIEKALDDRYNDGIEKGIEYLKTKQQINHVVYLRGINNYIEWGEICDSNKIEMHNGLSLSDTSFFKISK